MRLLLDTHVFLWWVTDNPALSSRARELIADTGNEVFFSAVSGWEIAIKAKLGRLSVDEDLERFITQELQNNSFQVLPIYLNHALRVFSLPDHHRDPFDRLLIAQAQVEKIPIISGDPELQKYLVDVVW